MYVRRCLAGREEVTLALLSFVLMLMIGSYYLDSFLYCCTPAGGESDLLRWIWLKGYNAIKGRHDRMSNWQPNESSVRW